MNRGRQAGYALVVAVMFAALLAVVLTACIAAVGARQVVTANDLGSALARDGLRLALHDACERLRWSPQAASGSTAESSSWGGTWTTAWTRGTGSPLENQTFTVDMTSRVRGIVQRRSANVELRPQAFVGGVVVGSRITLRADTLVVGGGVYGGASLYGREWLTFGPATVGGVALDGVHPVVWPFAAAHVAGSIWAHGAEIHAATVDLSPSWALDSDAHTATGDATELTQGPDSLFVQAMEEHDALAQLDGPSDVVDLGLLPPFAPKDVAASTQPSGYIVVRRAGAGRPVVIVGRRGPGTCPLALVIDGDAVVGLPDSEEILAAGALIVTGRLLVQRPFRFTGHVYAGDLEIAATTKIETPVTWRSELLPGLAVPVVVAVSDGRS